MRSAAEARAASDESQSDFDLVVVGASLGGFQAVRLLLATGFMGAYTTFSTWSYETVMLAGEGSYGRVALNLLASAAAGLAAVWLGLQLGKAL